MRVTARTSTKAGKGCGFLAFGLFAFFGFIALFGMGKMVWEGVRSRFWETVPATILTSELRPEHGDYILDVSYHYVFDGKPYTGTRLKPEGNKIDSQAAARREQQSFRSDMVVPCWVNPADPSQSYLRRAHALEPLLLLIPLLFIGIGLGGIYAMRRANRPRAISEKYRPGGTGTGALRAFSLVFVLVGGGFLYGIGVAPWLKARDSADWQEVPCKITLSHVSSHRTSKGGTSYSLEIAYEYRVKGLLFTSDRYDFGASSSGTKGWREKAVATYPVGRETVCYVNPADPSDAVLVRESGVGWVMIIPGIFFLVGLLLFLNAGKLMGGSRKSGLPSSAPPVPEPGSVGGLRGVIGDTGGPVELTRSSSALGGFIVILIVAIIWNGIVWGFLLLGDLPTGAKIFLSIFALIGLALIGGVIHQFLSLFNPQPAVQASASAVRLGESMEIRFSLTGKVQRITDFFISLKAEESATYRRGTNSVTDRHVFFETRLLETRDHALMRTGAVMLSIPNDLMHSFEAPNNKIIWTLTLQGSIPRWPDVSVSFPITVLPHRQETATT